MSSINVSNKKYSVLQKPIINNQDITITSNGNYYPSDDYTGFGLVRVNVPEASFEEITINPSTSTQILTPTSSGYSKVTVNAVTNSIDPNIVPSNILKGVKILGITGEIDTSTEDITITPSTNTQTFTPTSGGFYNVTVNAVSSIVDSNIKPENIKLGTNILGTIGSLVPVNNTTKNIYENGTYIPSEEFTGFSSVTVDINTVNNTDITINTNGTYTPPSPYTGYETVVVDVNTVNNTTLTVNPTKTEQVFNPPSPYTGYETVTIRPVTASIDNNIAPQYIKKNIVILGITGSYEERLQEKTLTVDSSTATITTILPDNGYSGMSEVIVDLSWISDNLISLNAGDSSTAINLQNKTFSSAGSYTCDDGYDGLGTVTINLDWVDEAIAQAKEGTPDGTADSMISNTAHSISTDADSVRNYAFYYQTNLQRLILTSATSIGNYAFAYSGLSTLTINSQSLCVLENTNAFTGTSITNIYVPSNLVDSYKSANNWNSFTSKISSIT